MKILTGLLKFVLLPIILVGQLTGWANLNNTLQLINRAIASGITRAVSQVRGPIRLYLLGLIDIAFIAVILPLPTALFGIGARGWFSSPKWETFCEWLTGWSGVWSMCFLVLLWVVGSPLGVLINSLAAKGHLWERFQEGTLITGEKWVSIMRTVLLYETFSLFFLGKVPLHHNWVQAAMFILTLFFLVFSGYEWHTHTGNWLKPLIRLGMMFIVIIQFLSFFFTSVNPLQFVFHGKIATPDGEVVVMSLKDVNNAVLEATASNAWKWLQSNYTSAGFIFSMVLLGTFITLLAYGITKLKKTGKSGEAGEEGAGEKSERHGMPWPVTLLILAAAGYFATLMVTKASLFHTGREAQIVAREEAQKVAEAIRRSLPAPRAERGPSGNAAPKPADEMWRGLKKPVKHSVALSTNWSRRIPRPQGMSARVDPPGLQAEILLTRQNGETNSWKRGTQLSYDVRYMQYRLTNSAAPVAATIGVGRETN